MNKWEKITADMMSEEEEDDNGAFICHRYAWCSVTYNHFIDKLEECIARNSLAKKRTYGSTLNIPPPPHAQDWMKSAIELENDVSQSEEIISSGDEGEQHETDQIQVMYYDCLYCINDF